MKKAHTAGGVVVGPNGKVLVVSQGGLTWSLPKGHVDPGETTEQAARREIQEESGVSDLTLIRELGHYERYRLGLDGNDDTNELKQITLFLFTTEQSHLAPEDPLHPEARWVVPSDVAALLSHPKDKVFFERILPEIIQLTT